jgi:phosphoglycerate kinase
MMINLRTIEDCKVRNRRVFLRADFNVPMEDGRVTDATRIERTLPTIEALRKRKGCIIIASHFGRPKGTRVAEMSLEPVGRKLAELTGVPVDFARDCVGEEAAEKAAALRPGEILLLENLRFHAGEEANDTSFAAELAELCDVYVNDAFGASHRAHASIDALPRVLGESRTAAGLLLAKEIEFLQRVTEVGEDQRPFVAILGGAKIKGKIEPLETLARLADHLLLGGGMANTFLAAEEVEMAESLVDEDSLDLARRLLSEFRSKILTPTDVVVTDSLEAPGSIRTVLLNGAIPDGMMAVDIGPETIDRFRSRIELAQTIFWNGPMGVFEKQEFSRGTTEIAAAVAGSNAVSVVGGGESVEAVNASGSADQISHISTGGGASLEFISGRSLPGVEILRKDR